jgi:hypothetical protein
MASLSDYNKTLEYTQLNCNSSITTCRIKCGCQYQLACRFNADTDTMAVEVLDANEDDVNGDDDITKKLKNDQNINDNEDDGDNV